MKFGSREICDVVLKAKNKMTLGGKTFYAGEPVLYFDTLKTTSLEGTSTTVYATGGKGVPRLMAWTGEKTVTFTMEDALISKESFALLTGADITKSSVAKPAFLHKTARVQLDANNIIELVGENVTDPEDSKDAGIFIMELEANLEDLKEPCVPADDDGLAWVKKTVTPAAGVTPESTEWFKKTKTVAGSTITYEYKKGTDGIAFADPSTKLAFDAAEEFVKTVITCYGHSGLIKKDAVALVDFYVTKASNVSQIEIIPEKFSEAFYLEGATLFRNTDGFDLPAEIIIPTCTLQSNFTIVMAASGDPSTFTFNIDVMPGFTKFDKTKKILATLQIVEDGNTGDFESRVPCESV